MKHILTYIFLLVLPVLSFSQVSESFGGRFIVTSKANPLPASDKFAVTGIFKHPRANYTADSIQLGDIFVDCNCNAFTVDSIYSVTGNIIELRVNPQDTTVNLIPSCTGGIIRINSPPNGTYTFPANIPPEIMDCFLNYNFQALSGLDTAYLANDTLYLVTPSDTLQIYIPTPYLNTLPDVDTANISNGDFLMWDSIAGNWIPQEIPPDYLNNLPDVDTANIDIDDILQWDGSNWIMTSPVELIGDGGGAYGSGLAGRTAYWLDDSTLVHTDITYSSTELNASALTGSFQWPTGTTAQQPVGANGKTRFNSTTGLFEGYHAAAYRPFATFDGTRTSGRIPYWDGTKLTSSSVLTFSGTTLNITQSSSSNAAFRITNGPNIYLRILQNGALFFGNDGNAGNIQRSGTTSLLTNFYSGGGGAEWIYQSNGSTFARIGSSGSTGNGYVRSKVFEPEGNNTLWIRGPQNSNNTNLSILIDGGYHAATNTSGGDIFIRGGSEGTTFSGSYSGNPGEIFLQTRVDSNTIGVRGNILTGLYIPYVPAGRGRAWVSVGGTHSPTAVLDVNGNVRIRTMPDSVAAYITMADASGYIYRATPGDVVAAGSGSTNSIYNLLPTQDILIDPNANDLIIGSFSAGNSGDFEFFTTNEDGQYAGIFAGTRDSSWLATAGDGFQFDATLFSTGAEDGIMGVNYNYFGTVWNAATFGDSILFAPYPGSELTMTINGLPDDPANGYKIMVQDTITDRVYLTSIDSLLGPEKWGAISTSTDGSGDIVVAHGMGVTPTVVDIQFTGTSGSATPYVYVVLTDGTNATNFTIRVFDMTGAAVASTAVTATWHCKT